MNGQDRVLQAIPPSNPHQPTEQELIRKITHSPEPPTPPGSEPGLDAVLLHNDKPSSYTHSQTYIPPYLATTSHISIPTKTIRHRRTLNQTDPQHDPRIRTNRARTGFRPDGNEDRPTPIPTHQPQNSHPSLTSWKRRGHTEQSNHNYIYPSVANLSAR